MALVKYNNNSISAITAAAAIPSGAMTLIKEVTASASATVSFVHGTSDVVLDSTYPIYKFEFIDIHPATDNAEFTVNFRDGSTAYDATKTSTFFNAYQDEADGGAGLAYNTANDLAQVTGVQNILGDVGNGNDESGVGYLYLFSPSSTTFVKHYIGQSSNYNGSNYAQNVFYAGYCNVTAAIDAVQFKMDSGNIDAGTIKLYGIKDS